MADSPKSPVKDIERLRKYLTGLINDVEGDVAGTRILAQPGSDVMGALSNWLHDVAQPNSGVNPDFLRLNGFRSDPGFSLHFRPGSPLVTGHINLDQASTQGLVLEELPGALRKVMRDNRVPEAIFLLFLVADLTDSKNNILLSPTDEKLWLKIDPFNRNLQRRFRNVDFILVPPDKTAAILGPCLPGADKGETPESRKSVSRGTASGSSSAKAESISIEIPTGKLNIDSKPPELNQSQDGEEKDQKKSQADLVQLYMLGDQAIERADDDLLGFDGYADALFGIIDHPSTRTPLTLAINAKWGVGKSSLVSILSERLQKRLEYERVLDSGEVQVLEPHLVHTFNAWLHDEAGDLKGAFLTDLVRALNSKRSRLKRLVYRLPSLLLDPYERHRRYIKWFKYGILFLLILIMAVVILIPQQMACLLVSEFEQIEPFITSRWNLTCEQLNSEQFSAKGVVGSVLASVILVVILFNMLVQYFSKTAKAISQFFPTSEKGAASGSLFYLRKYLGDLIESVLPKGSRLVVFIDDLERVRPPRAIEIMESVNQLLNHENVVVIFVADMPALAACAEIKYEKLAQRYDPSHPSQSPDSNGREPFGQLFLQKFVQLQFDLPEQNSERVQNMLTELHNKQRNDRQEPTGEDSEGKNENLFVKFYNWAESSLTPGALSLFVPDAVSTPYVKLYRSKRLKKINTMFAIYGPALGLAIVASTNAFSDSSFFSFDTLLILIFGVLALSVVFASLNLLDILQARKAYAQASKNARSAYQEAYSSNPSTAAEAARQSLTASFTMSSTLDLGLSGLGQEGAQRLARKYQLEQVTEVNETFQTALAVAFNHVDPVPRNAKRLSNRLRLRLYLLSQPDPVTNTALIEPIGPVTAAHVGLWGAMEERWPRIADALHNNESILEKLMQKATGPTEQDLFDYLKEAFPDYEGDTDLRKFLIECHNSGLKNVLKGILHYYLPKSNQESI